MGENFLFVEIAQLMNDERTLQIEHHSWYLLMSLCTEAANISEMRQQRALDGSMHHPHPAPKLINQLIKSKCKTSSESNY